MPSVKQLVLLVVILWVGTLGLMGQTDFVSDKPISPKGGPPSQGEMVITPEFNNLKTLLSGLGKVTYANKEDMENARKDYQAQLENHLKALEAKSLSGRWVRNFFVSETDNFFNDLSRQLKFDQSKPLPEEERINLFWKELNLCREGFYTLVTYHEYDAWLNDLLNNRCYRTFRLVKNIPFKKRLEQIKQTPDQYKDVLIKMIDDAFEYRQKLRPNSKPTLLGKTKDEVTNVLVRTPKGNWLAHNTRKDREFFESDILEVTAKESRDIVLADRRFIRLEGEAILAGWELTPQIPETLNKDIAQLIELLANDDWPTREKATDDLIAIGEPALPAVKEAAKSTDPEVRMRANLILKKVEKGDIDQQIHTLIESAVNQGQIPPIEQLRQLADNHKIISIIQTMLKETEQSLQSMAGVHAKIQEVQQLMMKTEMLSELMRMLNGEIEPVE